MTIGLGWVARTGNDGRPSLSIAQCDAAGRGTRDEWRPVSDGRPRGRCGPAPSARSATTTVAVLPVFLTGGLAVQISAELGFDPAGLGLAVAALLRGQRAGLAALRLAGGTLRRRLDQPARRARRGRWRCSRSAPWPTPITGLLLILLAGAWCNVLGQLASNLTLASLGAGVPARALVRHQAGRHPDRHPAGRRRGAHRRADRRLALGLPDRRRPRAARAADHPAGRTPAGPAAAAAPASGPPRRCR